ncbi:MAG: caspase family protein [Lachnospiraceae bacterium]|nr:caspase family protein [Lachnospiraceae bacterium]
MEERKALVVGIDDYPSCPLQGCCNDSEAIKDLLSNHGNGDPNFSVWKKDNVSTKGELRDLIEKCFDGDTDVALFYYSGHGHIDAVGGYLVTPDYSKNDPGVSLQDILTIANDSKCKEKIIILDSCYSGFMGSINTSGQNTANINEGVTIMTASRNSQASMEINGHGVFTSLLMEALKGGAADVTGHISIAGVYAFIDKALGPWEQRPVFKTNVTRFTSLRDVTPQVSITTLRKIGIYFESEDYHFKLNPSYEPTNKKEEVHKVIEPYAKDENTAIFSDLQKLESIGLVIPEGEEHMYYVAMNSKTCVLTAVGKQYWRLVKEGRI